MFAPVTNSAASSAGVRWLAATAILIGCAVYAVKVEPPVSPQDGQPQVPPPSALKVTPERIEFGEVPIGETRSASAEIVNTGTETVTVIDLLPTCGCLKATIATKQFSPGQRVRFELTYTAQEPVVRPSLRPGLPHPPENPKLQVMTDEAGRVPASLDVIAKAKVP